MQADVILNAEELQELIKSVLQYNGHTPISVDFIGSDGVPIDLVSAKVKCEGQGLKVRVASEESSLEEQVKQYSTMEVGKDGFVRRKS
jgi:HKD family nuclease